MGKGIDIFYVFFFFRFADQEAANYAPRTMDGTQNSTGEWSSKFSSFFFVSPSKKKREKEKREELERDTDI